MNRALWLLLLIASPNALAGLLCPESLRSLGLFGTPRPFDSALYEEFREEAKRRALSLTELNTPEKLFAYRDALAGSKDSFIEQVRTIEELGDRLFLASFLQTSEFHFSTAFPFLNRTARNPLIRSGSKKRAVLYSVKLPLTDPESLIPLLAHYSLCLASYRTQKATYYAETFDPYFTERSLHHLERAESHVYETLHLLKAPEPLIRKVAPDFNRYQAYLDGSLREAIEGDFRKSLSRKWFYDRGQDMLKSAGTLGLGALVFFTSESWMEGKLESRLAGARDRIESTVSAYSNQRIQAGTDEYNEILKAPSSLEDPYEKQIQSLMEEIAAGRDLDGELQAQVDELKRRKELLKD